MRVAGTSAAEGVFPDDDSDTHIESTLPERPRMPLPHEGKMDIQKNPFYVLTVSDPRASPKKKKAWTEN
jgi:hypothetical protein